MAGIIFWPYLRVDTQPMAIDVIRHIEHAVKVCGEDHVGIGTDSDVTPVKRTPEWERENREWVRGAKQEGTFTATRPDDLYPFIPDLNVANRFEVLAARLSGRGHSDARIKKILGGNFARVMGEVWGARGTSSRRFFLQVEELGGGAVTIGRTCDSRLAVGPALEISASFSPSQRGAMGGCVHSVVIDK